MKNTLSIITYLVFFIFSANLFAETITCPGSNNFVKKESHFLWVFPKWQWKLVTDNKIFNIWDKPASKNDTISSNSQLDVYIRYSNIIKCSYHVNSNNKTLDVTNEKSNMNIYFDTQKLDDTVWKKSNAGEYICKTIAGNPAACTIPYFNF
jgi:hypothetical protein